MFPPDRPPDDWTVESVEPDKTRVTIRERWNLTPEERRWLRENVVLIHPPAGS